MLPHNRLLQSKLPMAQRQAESLSMVPSQLRAAVQSHSRGSTALPVVLRWHKALHRLSLPSVHRKDQILSVHHREAILRVRVVVQDRRSTLMRQLHSALVVAMVARTTTPLRTMCLGMLTTRSVRKPSAHPCRLVKCRWGNPNRIKSVSKRRTGHQGLSRCQVRCRVRSQFSRADRGFSKRQNRKSYQRSSSRRVT